MRAQELVAQECRNGQARGCGAAAAFLLDAGKDGEAKEFLKRGCKLGNELSCKALAAMQK